jgi:hypothetical protein
MKTYWEVVVYIHVFLTSEVSDEPHVPAALLPEKEPPELLGYVAEWTAEPVWAMWRNEYL